MRAITFNPRAQRATSARQLRAHVLAVSAPAGQPNARHNVAEAAWLALYLFPAMLVFVSVLGV